MKLTLEGIKNREAWEKAGITLPGYDVEKVSEKARKEPEWVHFGIGNIFRIFIGGIADGLLEEGVLDRGITCVETFDYDVVDKIYDPYDYAANEKYFKIYQDECPQLVKLGFERKDNKTVQAIAEFRTVTKDNLEYFRTVCQKANKLVIIANNKIDFRSILNNHIGIYGDKYNSNDTKAGGSGYDY